MAIAVTTTASMGLAFDFSCTPTPLRLNDTDNSLTALMHRNALDPDYLLAAAAMLL